MFKPNHAHSQRHRDARWSLEAICSCNDQRWPLFYSSTAQLTNPILYLIRVSCHGNGYLLCPVLPGMAGNYSLTTQEVRIIAFPCFSCHTITLLELFSVQTCFYKQRGLWLISLWEFSAEFSITYIITKTALKCLPLSYHGFNSCKPYVKKIPWLNYLIFIFLPLKHLLSTYYYCSSKF